MYTENTLRAALRRLNPTLYDMLIRDKRVSLPRLMDMMFVAGLVSWLDNEIDISVDDKKILADAYHDLNEHGFRFAAE